MAIVAKNSKQRGLASRNIAICDVKERDVKIASLLVGKNLVRIFKKYASKIEVQNKLNSEKAPLVLAGNSICPWLLAFFQFTATIPCFLHSLSSMDRKFQGICFWYFQYKNALDLGHKQGGVNLKALFFSLKKLNGDVFQEGPAINFQKALDFFVDRAFVSKDGKSSWDDYIPLSPEWIVDLGEGSQLSRVLENLFSFAPTDCIFYLSKFDALDVLGSRVVLRCAAKLFFYALEAFISVKIKRNGICFLAFINSGKIWYQCDDLEVKVVGMNTVKANLSGAVLMRFSKRF